LLLQGQVQDGSHRVEGRIVEAPLLEYRREPRGYKERIALSQRDLELLRQAQNELPAGGGAARLHEAQVARGHLRSQRELELAQVASLAPCAEMVADA
jgi:hypothetical protein